MSSKNNASLLFVVLFILIGIASFAQDEPIFPGTALSEFLREQNAEKIYVHTDRDLYTCDDTLWYKIYLCDALQHLPAEGFRNVYVELLDEKGEIVVRNLLLSDNGFAHGEISFAEKKLERGSYVFRAYTKYQQNFGPDFYFRKKIFVEDLYAQDKSDEFVNGRLKPQGSELKIDLQFLPEGGHLSANLKNELAFIAADSEGNAVQLAGTIRKETGEPVARFETVHSGMGKITFIPETGVSYYAEIDGTPKERFDLPPAGDKMLLSIKEQNESELFINLLENHHQTQKRTYYLLCSNRGVIQFYLPIEMELNNLQLKIGMDKLGSGINQLTLYDALLRPVAERLVFRMPEKLLDITVKCDKKRYKKRDEVQVKVSPMVDKKIVPSNLSVSVVSQKQDVKLEKYPQHILSYLLLDSELRGNIENPSYYFANEYPETKEHLDLLMLTHGWRKYTWNSFSKNLPLHQFQKENGVVVRGKLERLVGKKAAENGKLTLLARSPGEFFVSETASDSLGYFQFEPLFIPDSATAFVQGLNKRNKKSTEILELESFLQPAPVDSFSLSFTKAVQLDKTDFMQKASLQLAANKEFHPDKYNIVLDEIDVIESVNHFDENDDDHFRMYGTADNVVKVDELGVTYPDIWSYISGRIPGVLISGDEISIRGNGMPLFLLDGTPVEKDLLDGIPVSFVDKIEVLKNAGNTAVFGSRGANGVIAVYTKRGENIPVDDSYYTGIINEKIRGYSIGKEFYSPNYQSHPSEKPDHRATLYWNPNLRNEGNKESRFSFFTSDDEGSVLIKIEGLGTDGHPGVHFEHIEVRND